MGSESFEDIGNPLKLSSVKLVMGQKGSYGWEIKVYNDDPQKALGTCIIIDDKLKKKYPNSI